MLRIKIISSLEKCFPDQSVKSKPELKSASFLKNERYSFQVCYHRDEFLDSKVFDHLTVESPLSDCINVYKVQYVPCIKTCFSERCDDDYERTAPGLYPDLLEPIRKNEYLPTNGIFRSLWFEIDPNGTVEAGEYPITIRFTDANTGETDGEVTLTVEVIDALLPPQKLIYTQWFHCDCLANQYEAEVWSERYWQIVENFMINARRSGINMIFTPLVTPELDTYVGEERTTTQLLKITKEGDRYSFDFSRLGRWIDLCDKVGFEYFEFGHLYTQHDATACPKVVATVDGEERQIFGWDTLADGDEYKAFLTAMIPALLDYLKNEKNGADKRCWFHLADEPGSKNLEQYQKLSGFLKPLIEGYPTLDALSNYEFFSMGLVEHPVAATTRIGAFLEHKVPGLWAYYCGAQGRYVSNRFIAMPSHRNRILGVQLYKYDIVGFLHWGFNFYNTQGSYGEVNPYLCNDADGFVPAGDTFAVYPGPNGTPLPSLRQIVFHDALQDMRALELCESLYGKEEVLRVIEEGIDPIEFDCYPKNPDYLLRLRRRINEMIKNAAN